MSLYNIDTQYVYILWCQDCVKIGTIVIRKLLAATHMFYIQFLMLMETLFGADGLSQLKGSVVVCAKCFQLHLIRLVKSNYSLV